MKIDSDNIFYMKRNSRYVPCGVTYPKDMLSDGLWYVRVTPSSRSFTNVSYIGELMQLNDKPIVGNATELRKLNDLACRVMDDEDFKKKLLSFDSRGYSINDIVNATIAALKKISEDEKAKDRAD